MHFISENKHVEKKSKFIAYYYKINNKEEIRHVIKELEREHKKANHICWAAIISGQELFKNDGEVGNPANTMLEVLRSKGKQQHLIAIVRYFGGIKLGPGGVKRAFKASMLQCLAQR